jgi:uncharacterized cupin superfamily protein
MDEARLENVGSGLAPVSEGWFAVDVADAAWVWSEAFGHRCVFESSPRVLAERPDLASQRFAELGITLSVLRPGQASGLYHAESAQEDFLVLAGACTLLIEDQERPLSAWSFVHCPPGTPHCFVATGEAPCAILMLGARPAGRTVRYPRSELALRHGVGVERDTDDPATAYAPFPSWRPGRPADWHGLPWV